MAENQGDGNHNKERPLYSMSPLEVTEPTHSGEFWIAIVATTVLFRNKYAPSPPVNVVFKVDDEEVERVLTGEESGRLVCEIPITTAGGHIVYAWLEKFPEVRRSKIIAAKEEPKSTKIPKLLDVLVVGERGNQKLLISASAEDDTLIKNLTVVIMDGNTKKFLNTGSNGACVHEMNFTEPERAVAVKVGNIPDLFWENVLLGPRP